MFILDLGEYIIKKLKESIDLTKQIYVVDRKKTDPFEKLIAIILSQNTNDKNAIKALHNLKEKVGLNPEKIANANLETIKRAIKPAGLHEQKSRRIKEIAEKIAKGELNLDNIMKMDLEEARKKLMKLHGIGPKTADVFLSIYGHKTIGVDTHINRVSKRLGLVPQNANYETIRKKLLEMFEGKNYDLAHRYLIALGRTYCIAKNPKCEICPLSEICKYYKEHRVKS